MLTKLHKIATALHPRLKALKMFTVQERREIHEDLKLFAKEIGSFIEL